MTEETAQIFDAPYKVYETRNGYNVICTNKVLPQLCWTTDKKDANRIARLPELYDALEEATHVICLRCLASNGTRPPNLAHFKKHCGFDDDCKYCTTKNYWKLLQKVRAGE